MEQGAQRSRWQFGEIALGQVSLLALLGLTFYELMVGHLKGLSGTSVHAVAWYVGWALGLLYCGWVVAGALGRREQVAVGIGLAGAVATLFGIAGQVLLAERTRLLALALAVGVAGVIVNYVSLFARRLSFRVKAALDVANAVFFAALLVLFVNMVSARVYARWDLTGAKFHELAPASVTTLKNLKEDVRAYAFMSRENALYKYVNELLERMRLTNPGRVGFEFVDPDVNPDHARRLLEKFDVVESEVATGVVVVEYGGRESKYIVATELAAYSPDERGRPAVVHEFRAERSIIGAIRAMERGEKVRVAFMMGHGTKLVSSPDPGMSLALLVRELRRENMDVFVYDIAQEMNPPAADLLVIAGPQQPIPERELALIEEYVARGGKLMLLLDPVINAERTGLVRTGLELLAERFGVRPLSAIVTAIGAVVGGQAIVGDLNLPLPCKDYNPDSPITSAFFRKGVNTYFALARPLGLVNLEPGVPLVPTKLVAAPREAWGEVNIASYAQGRPEQSEADIGGQLILAYAVEERANVSVLPGAPQEPGVPRAFIAGDSDFVTDQFLQLGGQNFSLIFNAIQWLTRKPGEAVEGIHPKLTPNLRLNIPANEYGRVMYPILFGLPLLAVVFGVVVWFMRRS